MTAKGTDEEFEFLVNLLASDGTEPDPPPGAGPAMSRLGSSAVDDGPKIEKRSDGKLDLGQVKEFYERKNIGGGKEKGQGVHMGVSDVDDPGSTDRSRNRSGKNWRQGGGLHREGVLSVSHFVEKRESDETSPWGKDLTPDPHGPESQGDFQGRTEASSSSPPIEDQGGWVDLLSEREAKQHLLEISVALKLKLPLGGDGSRSGTDRPRTLSEVENVMEFLVRMDELVWRRSEHGSDHGVFDSRNISALEERIRLWEKVARGPCS